jgi:hypothetical protein
VGSWYPSYYGANDRLEDGEGLNLPGVIDQLAKDFLYNQA